MRSFALALWQNAAGWAFTIVWIPIFLTFSTITLGRGSKTLGRRMLRVWGRTMLRLSRVTLAVEGYEHLRTPATRIATFNHASLLDIFVVCALLPEGGVPVVKREVLFYPLVGCAVYLVDALALDRRNQYRARASLKAAADRMARERLTVIIAPEGTRSRTGELGAFRLGAFHLALQSGAPLVPVVIAGSHRLQPRGQRHAETGRVSVRILAPISTADYTRDNLRQKAAELHGLYARELAQLEHEEKR